MEGREDTLGPVVVVRLGDLRGVDVQLRRPHLPLGPRARRAEARLVVLRVELRVVREHDVAALGLGDWCDELFPVVSEGRRSARTLAVTFEWREGGPTTLRGRCGTRRLGRRNAVRW